MGEGLLSWIIVKILANYELTDISCPLCSAVCSLEGFRLFVDYDNEKDIDNNNDDY